MEIQREINIIEKWSVWSRIERYKYSGYASKHVYGFNVTYIHVEVLLQQKYRNRAGISMYADKRDTEINVLRYTRISCYHSEGRR